MARILDVLDFLALIMKCLAKVRFFISNIQDSFASYQIFPFSQKFQQYFF